MTTAAKDNMKVTALASWFGSNRMLARHVGEELAGCAWVGVPFAGGMSELPHITARTLQVNDLHRHVINLARVAADGKLGPKLYRALRRMPYHPVALIAAQSRCAEREAVARTSDSLFELKPAEVECPDLEWAIDYFVAAWMTRHGSAGTPGEFRTGQSLRWNANGGDSAAHFHNAACGLLPWRRVMRRCNFTTLDCFDFLAKCKNEPNHGIYCDAPWPDAGDGYTHRFDTAKQRKLAGVLRQFTKARVVIRFGDHPLIRELYNPADWTWVRHIGRTQTNADAAEVLILNGRSLAKEAA